MCVLCLSKKGMVIIMKRVQGACSLAGSGRARDFDPADLGHCGVRGVAPRFCLRIWVRLLRSFAFVFLRQIFFGCIFFIFSGLGDRMGDRK
jgi:hypothetical protein